jgi:hypothetical protein
VDAIAGLQSLPESHPCRTHAGSHFHCRGSHIHCRLELPTRQGNQAHTDKCLRVALVGDEHLLVTEGDLSQLAVEAQWRF